MFSGIVSMLVVVLLVAVPMLQREWRQSVAKGRRLARWVDQVDPDAGIITDAAVRETLPEDVRAVLDRRSPRTPTGWRPNDAFDPWAVAAWQRNDHCDHRWGEREIVEIGQFGHGAVRAIVTQHCNLCGVHR